MKSLLATIFVFLSLSSLIMAIDPKTTINEEIKEAMALMEADMQTIDQLFDKIFDTDLDPEMIEEYEARPNLAEGIANYIDTISGGGPRKLVVLTKDRSAKPTPIVYKTEMDRKIYVNWYRWSVVSICKRLIETVEPIIEDMSLEEIKEQASQETLELIVKTKGCRNIVESELLNDSFDIMKLKHAQDQEVILLP